MVRRSKSSGLLQGGNRTTRLCIGALTLALCLIAAWLDLPALAGDEPGDSDRALIERLGHPDLSTREAAQVELIRRRSERRDAVLRELRLVADAPSLRYHGHFDMIAAAAAEHRVEDALPALVALMHVRLDHDSFPKGGRVQVKRLYPAATAVAAIGGTSLTRAVIGRVSDEETDDEVLRPAAWVLREHLGVWLATAAVGDAVDRATSDEARRRLQSVSKLLSEEVILIW